MVDAVVPLGGGVPSLVWAFVPEAKNKAVATRGAATSKGLANEVADAVMKPTAPFSTVLPFPETILIAAPNQYADISISSVVGVSRQ
jgi:hypothetical protein